MKQAVPWWFFFPDVTFHYLMWLLRIAAVPWGWCDFSRLMWLKYGACIIIVLLSKVLAPSPLWFPGVLWLVSADLAHTHLKTGPLTETTAVVDVKFQIDSKWTDWLTHSQDTVSILESSFRKETLANLKWQRQGFRTFLLETTISWKNGCSLQIRKFVLGAHGSKFHTSKIEYAVLFGFWKWTQNVHRILNLHWYPECHETRRSIWLLPLCPAIRWCLQQVGCCWWLPRSPARCQRVSETLSWKAWNGADYGLLAGSMDFWMMDDIYIYIHLIIYTYILYIVMYIYCIIYIYNFIIINYCTYHLILQFCRIFCQGLNWGFRTAVLRTVGIPCFQLVPGPSCQGSDIGPIGEGVLNIEPWKATTQQDNEWASGFKMQEDCTHSDGDGILLFG